MRVPHLPIRDRLPGTPLDRVRLLALCLALANLTAVVVINVTKTDASSGWPAGVVLPVVLAGYWVWGHRRERFAAAAEPLEALAVLAILHFTPGEPFLPLFGLVFRSLYGGIALALVRWGMWSAALVAAHAGRGHDHVASDLARVVGLSLVPVLIPGLRVALQGMAAGERRLRSLVQNSTDVTTVVGEDLRIRWQADAIRLVLGHEPDELLGTSLLDLVHPYDHAALNGYVHGAGPPPHPTETQSLRLRHRDGTYRDFDAAIADRRHDASVDGFVLNLRDETERRRLEGELRALAARLEHDSLHDPLTGLPNRRMLFARLHTAMAQAEVDRTRLVLLLIDLDQFKELNDTLGHEAGDELLREIRPRLAGAVTEGDLVARLGGDEFAILLDPAAPDVDAGAVAERLRAAIEEPFAFRGTRLLVRASIGIACYPEHAQDVQTLMRRADVAMYSAKSHGVGHEEYAASRDGHSRERLNLIGELPEAITDGQIVLYYQPKFDLLTGEIAGAEALVRWDHPEHGLLGPGAFLALAEHSGLMRPLTMHVLDQAIAQCARWQAEGRTLGIAVNLSGPDLLDRTLAVQIGALLRHWSVDPCRLQLEITETIVGADPVRVTEVLVSLRDLGVTLSLDDFGTGSSSLGYLRRLPVQELKLDKSFVIGMDEDEDGASIVRTVIGLAHDLGLRVVAEGIETSEVHRRLVALGCDQGQGFLLGRPMPADALTRLLREGDAALALGSGVSDA
jgi:diguanylate cyclase (GGDEF)-like protein/PAS domain S-box-containing protein